MPSWTKRCCMTFKFLFYFQNYLAMQHFGLNIQKPWFMKRLDKQKPKNKSMNQALHTKDEDKDWTPGLEPILEETQYNPRPNVKPIRSSLRKSGTGSKSKKRVSFKEVIDVSLVCMHTYTHIHTRTDWRWALRGTGLVTGEVDYEPYEVFVTCEVHTKYAFKRIGSQRYDSWFESQLKG